MKSIIYILPDKDAGVASVVRNLLRFKTNRFKTKVILLHNQLDNTEHRIQDDFNADVMSRLTYHGKWSSKYSIFKKILKEIDSHSVIISNDGGLDVDVLRHSKYSVPLVYIFHGDFKHYFNVLKEKGDKIHKIITVSNYLESKVKTQFSDSINATIISIKFPVPSAKRFEKIQEKKIRLIFVGALSERKGVLGLVRITKLLDEKNIDYSLTIVGNGELESKLKNQFENNLKIIFLGKLPNVEVLNLYKNQDIILLPSKGEGLPVVLVEAMKYGVVPLATNLKSGIPELIDHAINGFTLALDDFEGYANYIEQLKNKPEMLLEMSEASILKAERLFDPYEQAKKYEDAFLSTHLKPYSRKKKIVDYLPLALVHKLKIFKKW